MNRLKKKRFDSNHILLPEVQAFCCGADPWAVEVATWIKSSDGNNSVIQDMHRFGTEVWLYRTEDGKLVGFASLGETRTSVPFPKGKKQLVSVIPFLGVQSHFHGEPQDAARDDKYAYQILDDLIEEAVTKTHRYPRITLSVDRRNTRAIKFYGNRDFVNLQSPQYSEETGVTYERMALDIHVLVGKPPLPSSPK